MTKSLRLGSALSALGMIGMRWVPAPARARHRQPALRSSATRSIMPTSASPRAPRRRSKRATSPPRSTWPNVRSAIRRAMPVSAPCWATPISVQGASLRRKAPIAIRCRCIRVSRGWCSSWRWWRSHKARMDAAINVLNDARNMLDPADYGLALALAGQPQAGGQRARRCGARRRCRCPGAPESRACPRPCRRLGHGAHGRVAGLSPPTSSTRESSSGWRSPSRPARRTRSPR